MSCARKLNDHIELYRSHAKQMTDDVSGDVSSCIKV